MFVSHRKLQYIWCIMEMAIPKLLSLSFLKFETDFVVYTCQLGSWSVSIVFYLSILRVWPKTVNPKFALSRCVTYWNCAIERCCERYKWKDKRCKGCMVHLLYSISCYTSSKKYTCLLRNLPFSLGQSLIVNMWTHIYILFSLVWWSGL